MMFYLDLENESDVRYDFSKFMRYAGGDNYDPLTSKFLKDLKGLAVKGRLVIQGEEGRPDLISKKIYSSFQYWWLILLYNSILDLSELTIGKTILYPDENDLEDLYLSLKTQEQANS